VDATGDDCLMAAVQSAKVVVAPIGSNGGALKPKAPRRKRGILRVEKLLEAAAAAFAERGFDAATMTEIAERAGASIGSLYQFFPNKDLIADVLRSRYGDAISGRWNALTESDEGRTGKDLAAALFRITAETLVEHPSFTALMVVRGNPGVNVAKVRKRHADALRRLLGSRMPRRSPSELQVISAVVHQIVRCEIDLETEPNSTKRKARAEFQAMLGEYLTNKMAL
jgi:AcrR family transcriptional regulator